MHFDPIGAWERGWIRAVAHEDRCRAFLEKLQGPPHFSCVIASTETAAIEGISAAGETPEKRRYTAALDAEFLLLGHPVTLDEIPKNPLGPPSPVVITRAAALALGWTPVIIDAGTRILPQTEVTALGFAPGDSIETGRALDLPADFAERARAAGDALAREVLAANPGSWLILAESVPGGTTTALSLLEGLGYEASGKVSSSMPGGNHGLKRAVVDRALANAALSPEADGLAVARGVGDPMQPALALMALAASEHAPVVLGGGTQMIAVYALIARLAAEGQPGNLDNIAIATTRWVAVDESADLAGIAAQIEPAAPVFAAWLDFSDCADAGLRRYEEGLVKEGVGAGAAAFAALCYRDWSPDRFVGEIEAIVSALGGGNKGAGT